MVGWYEIVGERASPQPSGGVRLNTFYETRKKPLWFLALKSLGALAMLAVGFGLLIPIIPLPLWKSAILSAGVLLIYVGVAFFVRPEPNEDNMGLAGGLLNDPTQCADNMNRTLWKAHCMLGPGRFISETILDCCTLFGLTAEQSEEEHRAAQRAGEDAALQEDLLRLRDRVAERNAQKTLSTTSGHVELTSARLFEPRRFGE
jgi:hypothetical protein